MPHNLSPTALCVLAAMLPISAQKLDQLIPRNVSLDQVTYQGRSAIRVVAAPQRGQRLFVRDSQGHQIPRRDH